VSTWVLCTLCTLPVSAALAQAEVGTSAGTARIEVFKPEGSRQCEPDSGTALEATQRQLTDAGVEVYAARTTSDGMNQAQVCGAPTGRIHVFSIDAADAPVAADLNFLPALDPNLLLDPTAPAMPHQPNATP
jgi:hypothetical protein